MCTCVNSIFVFTGHWDRWNSQSFHVWNFKTIFSILHFILTINLYNDTIQCMLLTKYYRFDMLADALAPGIARSSATMILIM